MQGLGVRVRGLAAVYPKLLIAEVAEKSAEVAEKIRTRDTLKFRIHFAQSFV